jgi:hypothetical protein
MVSIFTNIVKSGYKRSYFCTGVKSFDVSLDKQTAEVVTVDDSLEYDTVLSTIKKTGKKVKSGEADGKEMPIEVPAGA